MSRCIRKIENEDWYIVYCNTSDQLFPLMFESYEAAEYFVQAFDNNEKWTDKVFCECTCGIILLEDLIELNN